MADSTPALARATEAYRAHRLAVPEMVCEACGFVVPTTADGERDHAAWFQHRIAATVSAALHDPDDPDALAQMLAEADGWTWAVLDDRLVERFRRQADAARAAILGGA